MTEGTIQPASVRRLTLIGLTIFASGFLSGVVGIAVLPPQDFPPWSAPANWAVLTWGWLTILALLLGALLSLAGGYRADLARRGQRHGATAADGARWIGDAGPFLLLSGAIMAWGLAETYLLGNPAFLGISAIRWAAGALLTVGIGRVILVHLRRGRG